MGRTKIEGKSYTKVTRFYFSACSPLSIRLCKSAIFYGVQYKCYFDFYGITLKKFRKPLKFFGWRMVFTGLTLEFTVVGFLFIAFLLSGLT